jgi:hypothetical protein
MAIDLLPHDPFNFKEPEKKTNPLDYLLNALLCDLEEKLCEPNDILP